MPNIATQPSDAPGSARPADLLEVFGMAHKLREINQTVSRFMGAEWLVRSNEIKTLIREIAAKEGKQALAVAIERAKACSSAMGSLQILAAAYEMSSSSGAEHTGKPIHGSHESETI